MVRRSAAAVTRHCQPSAHHPSSPTPPSFGVKSTKLPIPGCRVSAVFGSPFGSSCRRRGVTIYIVDQFTHGPVMRRTSSSQHQLSLAHASDAPASPNPPRVPPPHPQDPIVILRLPDVCRVTGLCRSLVYELESNGTFPRRVPLGARSVGWVEAEVQSWLAARVMARGAAHPRQSATAPDTPLAGHRARRTHVSTSPARHLGG